LSKNKILITGACGFIGSTLTEFLVEKGFSVIAYDRYNSDNFLGWLQNSKYKNDIEFILGDIRDYDSVYKASQKSSSCIHLAALIGIPYSYISPSAYIKTNIEGTYNILESCKNLNIDQLIVTSTSETYGTAQYIPIDEKHPLIGQSPYSATKIAADQLAISFNKSFDLPVKIIRPFNTFGPRQSARAIIPTIINQILNNKKEVFLGNIQSKRDFTFVNDLCEAFLEIYFTNEFIGNIVNVGNNKNLSIEDLFNIIKIKTNSKTVITEDKNRLRPKASEVKELLCDNSLILNKTKWRPVTEFSTGIDISIKWYKENYKLFDFNGYQI